MATSYFISRWKRIKNCFLLSADETNDQGGNPMVFNTSELFSIAASIFVLNVIAILSVNKLLNDKPFMHWRD